MFELFVTNIARKFSKFFVGVKDKMYSILNAIASCTLTVYVNVYEFHSRLKIPIMHNAASILSLFTDSCIIVGYIYCVRMTSSPARLIGKPRNYLYSNI